MKFSSIETEYCLAAQVYLDSEPVSYYWGYKVPGNSRNNYHGEGFVWQIYSVNGPRRGAAEYTSVGS